MKLESDGIMKEEYRKQMVERLNSAKKRLQYFSAELARYEELKEHPKVKEFVELSIKLNGIENMSFGQFLAEEKRNTTCVLSKDSCPDDICLIIGYKEHRDKIGYVPISREEYLQAKRDDVYVEFACMDCGYTFLRSLDEAEKFIKSRRIVNLNDWQNGEISDALTYENVRLLRDYYFELLTEHSVEETYEIFEATYREKIKVNTR